MIAAVIASSAVAVALACVLCALLIAQGRERVELARERQALVDRAIAQHTGEVIALDRARAGKHRERDESVVVEGLNG